MTELDAGGSDALVLTPEHPAFPTRIVAALGTAAPARLTFRGDPALLHGPLEAIFCSTRPPPELVLPAVDLAHALADSGRRCIGGFHSPVERLMLDVLLRRRAPVVVCTARAQTGARHPHAWREAEAEGRLLVVSAVERRRRADAALAAARNRLVGALAGAATVVYAAPGGRVQAVVAEMIARGCPIRCPEDPANEELLLLGARAWAGGEIRDAERASR